MLGWIKARVTRRFFFLMAISAYLGGCAVFFTLDSLTGYQRAMAEVDAKLRLGASAIVEILGPDYHDRWNQAEPLSDDQNWRFTKALSRFTDAVGLKYLYTVVREGDHYYYTSSSALPEDFTKNTWSAWYEEYNDAPEALKRLFTSGGSAFVEDHDKYGSYRSYWALKTSPGGRTYLIGADESIDDVKTSILVSILRSLGLTVLFLSLAVPFIFLNRLLTTKEQEALVHDLVHDKVTGLPRRERFVEAVQQAERPVCLLVNLEYLNEINDYYGYAAGDKILTDLARRLEGLPWVQPGRVFKINSDEFAVLLDTDLSDPQLEERVQHLFREATAQLYEFEGEQFFANVCLGVARLREDELGDDLKPRTASILLSNANIALQKAREQNKQYVVYDETLAASKEYEKTLTWAKKVRTAIETDRIVPYYQPIVNNSTGSHDKYETLIRLIDQDDKVISPFLFLGPAKKYKLYNALTRIVIEKAFAEFRDADKEFSINIGIHDILDVGTAQFLFGELAVYHRPERVVFELLESEGIENYDVVAEFIRRVKAFGCKVAIDDFGSGYSNFEHLLKLDIDYIKIDASMIKNIVTDPHSVIVTETIVGFSRSIKAKTIAEFVHNEAVFLKVKELGVDFSQGYHFGEPRDSHRKGG